MPQDNPLLQTAASPQQLGQSFWSYLGLSCTSAFLHSSGALLYLAATATILSVSAHWSCCLKRWLMAAFFTGCEATANGPLQACALGGGCGCFVTSVCDMPAPEDFEAGVHGGNSFGFGAGGFAGGCNGAFTGGGSAKSGGAGSIGSTCSGDGGSAFAAALALGKGRYALSASNGISLGQHNIFISSSAGLSVAIWGKFCSQSRVCLKNFDVWLSGSSP